MIPIQFSEKRIVHEHSMYCIKLIKDGIKEARTNGYVFNKKTIYPSIEENDLLKVLERDTFLISLFSELPEHFEQKINFFTNRDSKIISKTSTLNRLFYFIFVINGYEKLSRDEKWRFIKNIGLDTCPYCNRNYTYSLEKSKGIKPEIDHFYPKSKYPFLALSFFNLIPSCNTCNSSSAKGQSDPIIKKLVSPYLQKHNDFYFTYEVLSSDILNPLGSKNCIKIDLVSNVGLGNIGVLKLLELYQKHEDHVLELIVKSQLSYSQEYRKYLESYENLSFSKSEIDRMILGNYTFLEDLHKRPLSKLYRDVAIQLGLIKGENCE